MPRLRCYLIFKTWIPCWFFDKHPIKTKTELFIFNIFSFSKRFSFRFKLIRNCVNSIPLKRWAVCFVPRRLFSYFFFPNFVVIKPIIKFCLKVRHTSMMFHFVHKTFCFFVVTTNYFLITLSFYFCFCIAYPTDSMNSFSFRQLQIPWFRSYLI